MDMINGPTVKEHNLRYRRTFHVTVVHNNSTILVNYFKINITRLSFVGLAVQQTDHTPPLKKKQEL